VKLLTLLTDWGLKKAALVEFPSFDHSVLIVCVEGNDTNG